MPCPACDAAVLYTKSNEVIHTCGARLKRWVPIFAIHARPYGWAWREVKEEAK